MAVLDLNSRTRLMVLAPHPDDEALAAGGLLYRAAEAGAAVRVVFIRDGDNNPWPQRVIEKRWSITPIARSRWGQRRRAEAQESLARLGVAEDAARFYGLPDGGLTDQLARGGEELVERLAAELLEFRPTVLVTPAEHDIHPDHSAVALITRLALHRAETVASPLRLDYVIHTHAEHVGDPAGRPEGLCLSLSAVEQVRKRQAIEAHETQLRLSRKRFLAYARPAECFSKPNSSKAHPVREFEIVDGRVRILAAPHGRPSAFGTVTVCLAGIEGDRLAGFYRVELAGGAKPSVCDASGRMVAMAGFRNRKSGVELTLPADRLPRAERWFVKLERSCGFRDEAGWREFSMPKTDVPQTDAAVCCVIPCYNVEEHCEPVVREAAKSASTVLAVDDGSTDGTGEILRRLAADPELGGRVKLLALEQNGGKGAALIAAFEKALASIRFDVLITLDGDGQHSPSDIPRLVEAFRKVDADLVVGARFQDPETPVPLRSRIGNSLATWGLRLRFPDCPSDTQSGLRAHSRRLIEEIVHEIEGGRYETEMQILLLALRRHCKVATIPIRTIYLDENRSSHFDPMRDALRITRVMLGLGHTRPHRFTRSRRTLRFKHRDTALESGIRRRD